jgi:hypothetical protein
MNMNEEANVRIYVFVASLLIGGEWPVYQRGRGPRYYETVVLTDTIKRYG